jgi:hypothetical protein
VGQLEINLGGLLSSAAKHLYIVVPGLIEPRSLNLQRIQTLDSSLKRSLFVLKKFHSTNKNTEFGASLFQFYGLVSSSFISD